MKEQHDKDFSKVEARYIVMPYHANPNGMLFGGILVGWIDLAAAMVAEKHSGMNVATVCIEKVEFSTPILISEHVIIRATMMLTGRSSMKVNVQVFSENVKKRATGPATNVVVTLVALNDQMKATEVPTLI